MLRVRFIRTSVKRQSGTFLSRHGYFRNGLARELRVFRRKDRESTRLRQSK